MNSSMFLAILLMAAVTFLTRWLPFAAFRPGQPIPKTIAYLGQVLPLAMMAMLVVYGLRSTDWLGSNHGLPELLALEAQQSAQHRLRHVVLYGSCPADFPVI